MNRSFRPRRAALALAVALLGAPVALSAIGIRPALAQTASDIRVDLGAFVIRIPRLEAAGASLSAAELRGLFDPAGTEPLSRRLARLDASEIVIPEIIVEQTIGTDKTTTTYRDTRLRDIKAGRVGEIVVAGGLFQGTMRENGKSQSMGGTFGRMSMTGTDLAHIAKIYGEVAGPEDREPRTLYSGFVMDGMKITVETGMEIAIARMSGKEARGRATATPLVPLLRELGAIDPKAKLPPEESAKQALRLFDMLDAFTLGDGEITGFTIRDPSGKQGPVVASIARIGFQIGEKGSTGAMEGLSVDAKDGRVRIGGVSMSDFSFKPTLTALREALSKPNPSFDSLDPKTLIPTLGALRIRDIDIDVPDEKAKNRQPGQDPRVKLRLRAAEFSAGDQVNGIPTKSRLAVDGLAFDIPAGTTEKGLKDILALGYRTLDVSSAVEARWHEAKNEIEIQELSFSGTDMGRLEAKGVLGNATKALFSGDATLSQIAALGLTAKSLEIRLENRGLFEKVVAQEARKAGKKPEDLRREYGAMAALVIPAMLGPSAAAKDIGNAIAQFIARPGRLTLAAKTKDGAGLGIGDVAAVKAPAALLERLDVQAKAE